MSGSETNGKVVSFTTKELILATIFIITTIIGWGWWILTTVNHNYTEFILYKQHIEDTIVKNQERELKDLSTYVKQKADEAFKLPGTKK